MVVSLSTLVLAGIQSDAFPLPLWTSIDARIGGSHGLAFRLRLGWKLGSRGLGSRLHFGLDLRSDGVALS